MFSLLLAMVLFGIWHGATVLFVLFGCYHGCLLILHRLSQKLQRRFNWEPAGQGWTMLCWLVTTALISLGWIFFRANSLSQAGQMFSALLSPAGYARHVLGSSLYLIVAIVAGAYAIMLFVIDRLDHYANQLDSTPASFSEVLAIAVRERWVWIAPIWTAAVVLLLTIVTSQSRAANVFMYRLF